MKQRVRSGQATVEFAIVISVFLMLLFGSIEVARAIYEKQALARAAEVVVQELGQTDPEVNPSTWSMSQTDINNAIANASTRANLGLTAPDISTISTYQFNSATNACDSAGTGGACEIVTSSDGSVVITGFPDLSGSNTTDIRVTVSQPYHSFVQYPLQFLGGSASATVEATTLTGQQQQ